MWKNIAALFLSMSLIAAAGTPPPSNVGVIGGTDNTKIGNVSDALKVYVESSGSSTVNQGTAGSSPWLFHFDNTTIAVTGTFFQSTQPVSAASLPLPTNAAVETGGHLASIDTKLTSPLAVTGTFFQATQPVSIASSVNVTQSTGTNLHVVVDSAPTTAVTGTFFQATQPISAVSLPLPTGAATQTTLASILTNLGSPFQAGGSIANTSFAATQATAASLNATVVGPSGVALAKDSSLTTINTTLGTPFQAGGSIGNTTFSSTQSGTWNINNISGTVSLPTGAATQTTLASILTNLGSPFQAGGSIGNTTFASIQATAANLNATVVGPAGAALAKDSSLTTINTTLGTPFQAGGSIGNTTFAATQATASSLNMTDAADGSVAAGTAAVKSHLGGMVYNSTLPAPTNGQQVAIQSDLFANLQTSLPDMYVTGQSAQTALINNILTPSAGTAAIDLINYRQGSVQVVSSGLTGAITFEGCNDNVNFQSLPVINQAVATAPVIAGAINIAVSNTVYTFPITARYIRLRISTAVTGGTIQAFSKFSQAPWIPTTFDVHQSTAANLLTTVSGTVTAVSQTMVATLVADVTSAAIITTTTTASITPSFGVAHVINIPVTVISGSSPTMDVEVQESMDSGTNWVPVYDFPRITTTGSYNSPSLMFRGNRIRYVQTIGGSSPSFTRAINRLQSNQQMMAPILQIIDRTVTLTSLGSVTATLTVNNNSKNIMLAVNIGATTIAPILQLQCSEDLGATWYSVGSPLTASASNTVTTTIANVNCELARAQVATAGTVTTAGYVLIRTW